MAIYDTYIKTFKPRNDLLFLGYKDNPNLYIGDGFMFCGNCGKYRHHYAMTVPGTSMHTLVCKECHHGK